LLQLVVGKLVQLSAREAGKGIGDVGKLVGLLSVVK